ncbi:hypothetical protein B0H10DRAFT_2193425 [Mycena sp. CBHHK59/15]|nr:hypothetical protein B0H10DRAFT_2193425 [Mycena sp. CBHHK59/15]
MASGRPRRGTLPDNSNIDTSQLQPAPNGAFSTDKNTPLPTGNAHWTREDEEKLISYLWDHHSEGDGYNFKTSPTWTGAAAHLNKSITKGGAKNSAGCKGKWALFKKLYDLVELVKLQSGWTWTHAGGTCITAETASTWNDFVKKNKDVARFRNKGWVHLAAVAPFMVGKPMKGTHVFRASQVVVPLPINEEFFPQSDGQMTPPAQEDNGRYSPTWGDFDEDEDESSSPSPIPETPRTPASVAPPALLQLEVIRPRRKLSSQAPLRSPTSVFLSTASGTLFVRH